MNEHKLTARHGRIYWKWIESLSAWDIAEEFSIDYDGDSNPINHGGFFYDASTWEAFGYASVLEFWENSDETIVVSQGTINKPDDQSRLLSALRCSGIDPNSEDASNTHAQIRAIRYYCGIEHESTGYPCHRSYRLSDWQEWRIWKSVAPLLKELRS